MNYSTISPSLGRDRAKNEPILTVITPARNAGRYIDAYAARFIDFAARSDNSTLPSSVQVIVVDHASSDDTAGQLTRMADQLNFVELYHAPAELESVDQVRMFAVTNARGAYVWFCDIDDRFDIDGIFDLVRRAAISGVDLAVFNADRIAQVSGKLINSICDAPESFVGPTGDTLERVLRGRIYGHLWNKLFQRELIDFAHIDPAYRAHGDLKIVLNAARNVSSRLDSTETLYWYVQNPGSLFHSRPDARAQELRKILSSVEAECATNAELRCIPGSIRV